MQNVFRNNTSVETIGRNPQLINDFVSLEYMENFMKAFPKKLDMLRPVLEHLGIEVPLWWMRQIERKYCGKSGDATADEFIGSFMADNSKELASVCGRHPDFRFVAGMERCVPVGRWPASGNVDLADASQLDIAAAFGALNCAEFLLKKGERPTSETLFQAIAGGNLDLATLISTLLPDVDATACVKVALEYRRHDIVALDWVTASWGEEELWEVAEFIKLRRLFASVPFFLEWSSTLGLEEATLDLKEELDRPMFVSSMETPVTMSLGADWVYFGDNPAGGEIGLRHDAVPVVLKAINIRWVQFDLAANYCALVVVARELEALREKIQAVDTAYATFVRVDTAIQALRALRGFVDIQRGINALSALKNGLDGLASYEAFSSHFDILGKACKQVRDGPDSAFVRQRLDDDKFVPDVARARAKLASCDPNDEKLQDDLRMALDREKESAFWFEQIHRNGFSLESLQSPMLSTCQGSSSSPAMRSARPD
jgi:hypothetical protein